MPNVAILCARSKRRRLWQTFLRVTAVALMTGLPIAELSAQGHGRVAASSQTQAEGNSSREAREAAIKAIPFQILTAEATAKLHSVIDNASYFRRMPTQVVDCDPDMYSFLVRHPEVVVNIWDVMGVTKVTVQRQGPYQLKGNDGAGTTCNLDLVFGNESMHIYYSTGSYQGSLWPRELKGKCVVILYNRPGTLADGTPGLAATMDVFMKLESLGADLVVKTLGPLVSKTADYNFIECAQFFEQISLASANNPVGMQQLAQRLTKVDPKTREQFASTSMSIAQRTGQLVDARQAIDKGVAKTATSPERREASEERPSILSMGPKVPPPEVSSRRTQDASARPMELDRVDSPTILLLGSGEDAKKP